jgi:uncharacterized protein (UPF0254 family)
MGAMKQTVIDHEQTVLMAEPTPLVEKEKLVKRIFSIDAVGGIISVSETAGFNRVGICVSNGNRKSAIEMDYEAFSELCYLQYIVNCNRQQARPF